MIKMDRLFKKTKYAVKYVSDVNEPSIKEGTWVKCEICDEIIYKEDFFNNNRICTKCEQHTRIDAYARLELVLDKKTFEPMFEEIETGNPLEFPGYSEKINKVKEKTNLNEGVVTGTGKIGGIPVAIGVMDSRFLMGSMGAAVGEKITLLIEFATKEKLPLILFTASGGARMQEGMVSLMQMAKTSAAIGRFSDAGGLYITVLTDPTTGGVTASFAMLGDIILAEPGTLIGFAGPRVIKQTIKQDLPEGFQRAEFLVEHGFVDRIVNRNEMKSVLTRLLKLHK